MNISPPLSPKADRQSLLPSYAMQLQAAQQLRPLAVLHQHQLQQQQQLKQPHQWKSLLQQLASSKKAAGVFYTLLAVGLIWYVAAGRSGPDEAARMSSSTIVTTSSSGSGSSINPLQDTTIVSSSSSSSNSSDLDLGPSSDSIVQDTPPQVDLVDSTTTTTTTTSSSSSSSSGSGSSTGNTGGDGSTASSGSSTSSTTSSSSGHAAAELHVRCPYGSLPGTWVSDAPAGSKWQVLDPDCQLENWLAVYATAANAAAHTTASSSSSSSSSGTGAAAEASGATAAGEASPSAAASNQKSSSSSSSAAVLPFVNFLLLSDSVDRYIVQHVCDYLHGAKHTIRAQQAHMQHTPTAGAPAQQQHHQEQQQEQQPHQQEQQQQEAQGAGSTSAATAAAAEAGTTSPPTAAPEAAAAAAATPTAAAGGGGPSNLNATAYAFHTCQLPEAVPLKLASSYFPGVHPTGPFHRGLTQDFAARINAAVTMWEEYEGAGQPPHVVSVASTLWDVARLWMHERHQLEGPELSRPLLDGWMKNFSSVVEYSRQQLPQTQLWVTHTTMLPAHDTATGLMSKPYLGRRYFIEQLNAAAATAAKKLDMQLVDYAGVSSRFMEGQTYLTDLIHPNAEVALEVFNLLLNLAIEPRGL